MAFVQIASSVLEQAPRTLAGNAPGMREVSIAVV
jgi:hypothetical protein